jgi:Histidine kinase-, DNA gyrase B-, and HSP90-like ATPase
MELKGGINQVKSNVAVDGAFTITTSAKAFKILSDNLYSDKIMAVIRELSCNAYDAHVTANKGTTPFEVHMPTREELYFAVKDFGTGMSRDFVMNLYTSYFNSDKTMRNDLVGALGLGSKSPFAYTDTFTVTSILDGTKSIYTCYINKDGTPNISLMNESKTEEANGVEVRLPVKMQDIGEFETKAQNVFKYFTTHPTFSTKQRIPSFDVLYHGKQWKLLKHEYDSHCIAVQGNVAYPIDYNRMNLNRAEDFVTHNSFILDFDIGELDIAASREALSYDESTIANLKKKMNEVHKDLVKQLTKKIANIPSKWDAVIALKGLISGLSYNTYLRIPYKGEEIIDTTFKVSIKSIQTSVHLYKRNTRNPDYIGREILTRPEQEQIHISPTSNIQFVVNDQKRTGVSKVKILVSRTSNQVYVIENEDPAFLNAMGNPKVIFASELPDLPKTAKVREAKEQKKTFIPFRNGRFDENASMSMNQLEKSATKYYVIMKRNRVMDGEVQVEDRRFRDMVEDAIKIEALSKDVQIFGVPYWAPTQKWWKNISRITPLFSVLEDLTKETVKANMDAITDYADSYATFEAVQQQEGLYNMVLQSQAIANRIKKVDSKFFVLKAEFASIIVNYRKGTSSVKMSTLYELACRYSMIKTTKKNIERIESVYPMLKVLDKWNIKNYIEEVAEYINLVDEVR